jgi:hypothetical protein
MASKGITELTNVASVKDTDLLVVETSEGTRSVSRSGLLGGAMVHPYNLLDNSDFRNPVNQRGETSYNADGYTIDRWQIFVLSNTDGITSEVDFSNGYMYLGNKTYIQQRFKKGFLDSTKYYTVYIEYADGEISVSEADLFFSNEKFDYINIHPYTLRNIKCVALYEGEYTADTVPTYIPKGYATEMAECLRYFERIGNNQSEVLGHIVRMAQGDKVFMTIINYSKKRTGNVVITLSNADQYRVLMKNPETGANIKSALCDTIIGTSAKTDTEALIMATFTEPLDSDCYGMLQRRDTATAAYIDISADL